MLPEIIQIKMLPERLLPYVRFEKEHSSSQVITTLQHLYRSQATDQLFLKSLRLKDKEFEEIFTDVRVTREVKSLDLSENEVTLRSLIYGLTVSDFSSLTELDMSFNWIGWEAVSSKDSDLIKSASFPPLEKLNLRSNKIGPEGVKILSRVDLPLLRNLNLSECYLGDAGIAYLVESDSIRPTKLDISSNTLTNESFRIISRSPFTENLKILKVGNNSVSNPKDFNIITGIESIEVLSLSNSTVDSNLINNLLSELPCLTGLILDWCEIDEKIAEALCSNGNSLGNLSLKRSTISDDAKSKIQESLQQTKLIF